MLFRKSVFYLESRIFKSNMLHITYHDKFRMYVSSYINILTPIFVHVRNRIQGGSIFPHFSVSLDTLHSYVLPFSRCPHSLSPFALFMCKQHGPHNHHRMNELERARGKRWFTSRRIYRCEHGFWISHRGAGNRGTYGKSPTRLYVLTLRYNGSVLHYRIR